MKAWLSGHRWRDSLLLVSLCANAVFTGYLVSIWIRPDRPLETLTVPRVIERVASRLPQPDADILWRVYQSKQSEFAAARSDYFAALVKPVRLLSEDKLDPPALRKAVKESRDKRVKIGDLALETFLEAVEQMSPESRRKLVGGIGLQ
ncbi:MAG: periplasmic heavy metal sensor [Pseudomonadota bacterium]